MKAIKFIKMHGLGNDFIIVKNNEIDYITDREKLIQAISDRKAGIGCDQFILYKFQLPNFCDMLIYNGDGSVAEACGNGTRCLASLINDEYSVKDLQINTKNRIIYSSIIGDEVSVNMGKPKFEAEWIPDKKDLFDILNLFDISIKEIQCVDVGNPHLVVFSKNINEISRKTLIEKIYSSNLFKNGVNISFATIEDDIIDLYVWERGAGYTLACGSGACASFAAANKLGFIGESCSIKFQLGFLKLYYNDNDIIMTGPSTKVIFGDYYYDAE